MDQNKQEGQKSQWVRPQIQILFTICSNTETIDLEQLPQHVKKIKVHICALSGLCKGNDHEVSWVFSTLHDIAKTTLHVYHQNAWSCSNEMATFKLDHRKVIDVKRSGQFPSIGFSLTFEILAYK